jgi:Flp pilus assembly protein TadD
MRKFSLPNRILCIMLNAVLRCEWIFRRSCALLLFISCITFHTFVSADFSDQVAEKYRALGYAEQQKGNLDDALTHYIKATSLGVENAALLNDMGVLYEKIDLNTKAVHYYTKAIQIDSNYLPAYNNLAYLYQKLGRNEQAAFYFKKRYELGNTSDPWAQKAKDELVRIKPEYRTWARSVEAESLSNELAAQQKDAFYKRVERSQQHYLKGEGLFEKGRFKEAMTEYNIAIELAPRNPKISDARKSAFIEITKEKIREQSEQAIKMLEAGDTVSARIEIQKMLTVIPKEPILSSR